MSRVAVFALDDYQPVHGTADEFENMLDSFAHPSTVYRHMKARAAFVEAILTCLVGFRRRSPKESADCVGMRWTTFAIGYLTMRVDICVSLHTGATFVLILTGLIAIPRIDMQTSCGGPEQEVAVRQLVREAEALGYDRTTANAQIRRGITRILLHKGTSRIADVSDADLDEYREALDSFGQRPDLNQFFGSAVDYEHRAKDYRTNIYYLHTVLFHRGHPVREPHKRWRETAGPQPLTLRMEAVLRRYCSEKALICRPSTIMHFEQSLRWFGTWLIERHPDIQSFAEATRQDVLEFRESLNSRLTLATKRLWSEYTKRGVMCNLSTFSREVATWEWEDVPHCPLLGPSDLPRMPQRVPRYIPEEELGRLMTAVRQLPCPFQRTALLVARWSGARRDEIERLEVDCLDAYPDGTPRLRVPAGKCKKERCIPLNEEAAEAIRSLLRSPPEARGYRDSQTGRETQYLFLHRGKPYHRNYLFSKALQAACSMAGLVNAAGKPTVTAHRFRHTVGTQLTERGARLQTVMSVLGHSNANMAMIYAQISDREVLKDYQSVLGPGATIAGPCAEALRSGALTENAVQWLKSNFFKTELELGHCLRLPQEGPCECDLYLNCAKFVTTPEYAPRLRHRSRQEMTFVDDAASHGWDKEVERHRCTIRRIEQLLREFGEPFEGKEEGLGAGLS